LLPVVLWSYGRSLFDNQQFFGKVPVCLASFNSSSGADIKSACEVVALNQERSKH